MRLHLKEDKISFSKYLLIRNKKKIMQLNLKEAQQFYSKQ